MGHAFCTRWMVALICISSVIFFVVSTPDDRAFGVNKDDCGSPPSDTSKTPATAPLISGFLFINEVLPFSQTPINCSGQAYTSSWIELYSAFDQPIDLYASHYSISNSYSNTNGTIIQNYFFPLGSVIPAHGFFVAFPEPQIHFERNVPVTLSLSCAGTFLDTENIPVPELGNDVSYARISDGGDSWQKTASLTPGASNDPAFSSPTPTLVPSDTPVPSVSKTPVSHKKTPTATATKTQPVQLPKKPSITALPTHDQVQNHPSNTADAQIDGVQPVWLTLHLPESSPQQPLLLAKPSPSPSSVPLTPVEGGTINRKVGLTLAVALLAFVLQWLSKRHL